MKNRKNAKELENEANKEMISFEEKVASNNKFYYWTIAVVILLLVILFLILNFTVL